MTRWTPEIADGIGVKLHELVRAVGRNNEDLVRGQSASPWHAHE